MDGAADATAAALGAWASIRGFFTPATLFIVVNLVIGTIALSSSFQQRRRRGNGYTTAHDDAEHHQQYHQELPFQQAQHQENNYYNDQQQHQYVPPPPAPAPLARTSSVLDRLRSIGLYRFRSGDFPPEYAAGTDIMVAPAPASGDAHHARSRSEPALAREVKRRPAASRTRKSPRSIKTEVAPAPAARLVQAAVLEEDDADDVVEHEQEYARADEFTGSSNFVTQPLPPALQLQEEQSYREEYVPPFRPARAPSVLERIRSFGFRSGEPAADHAANAVPVEEQADDVEEEEYARADVFTDTNFTTHWQQQQPQPPARHEEDQYYREEYVPPPRPAPLARAPSVLERLRSFGLSRFSSGNIAADDAAAAVAELERNHAQKQARMTKSRSEPSREQSNKGKKQQQESAVAKMSKSGSVARKPVPAEPQAEAGGVDARADDFINSFRKQLQLQRLNSLLNYKDMLNRGA